MAFFWVLAAVLVWISYESARDRGVPWFSLGGTAKSRQASTHMKFRLRTENIKPRSPWLNPSNAEERPAAPSPPHRNKERFPAAAYKRLDELTHNPETSRRLVAHTQQLHPDRSLKWCAEKAIYDIERDRMAR